MDTIAINGISCEANLGLLYAERSEQQALLIDVLLFLDLEAAGNQDELSLTVDYERVVRKVQEFVSDHEFKLLEAVAGRLCRLLLADEPVESVRVTVRRFPPGLREDIDHIAVDMSRG